MQTGYIQPSQSFQGFHSETLKTTSCSGPNKGVPPFREIPREQKLLRVLYIIYTLERKLAQLNNQNETLKPRIFFFLIKDNTSM